MVEPAILNQSDHSMSQKLLNSKTLTAPHDLSTHDLAWYFGEDTVTGDLIVVTMRNSP